MKAGAFSWLLIKFNSLWYVPWRGFSIILSMSKPAIIYALYTRVRKGSRWISTVCSYPLVVEECISREGEGFSVNRYQCSKHASVHPGVRVWHLLPSAKLDAEDIGEGNGESKLSRTLLCGARSWKHHKNYTLTYVVVRESGLSLFALP